MAEFRPVYLGRVPGEEDVPLMQASGRVLAQDVQTRLPMPNCALARADGYAVHSREWQKASEGKPLQLYATRVSLAKIGYLGFGLGEWLLPTAQPMHTHAWSYYYNLRGPIPPEQAEVKRLAFPIRALQPLPYDCDSVIRTMSPLFKGRTYKERDRQRVIAPVPTQIDLIPKGSHVVEGELLLKRGQPLGGKELAMLASAGISQVNVFKKPRVGVLVVHQAMRPIDHQAPTAWLPDWFTPMVAGMLTRWGFEPEEVRVMPFDEHTAQDGSYEREIRDFHEAFDYTLVYMGGYRDSVSEWPPTREGSSAGGAFGPYQHPITEPGTDNADGAIGPDSFTLYAGQVRSTESMGTARQILKGTPSPLNGQPLNCFTYFRACSSPLSVLIGMHLIVRPVLNALSGVGAFPVLVGSPYFKLNANASETIPWVMPLPRCGFNEQWEPTTWVNGQEKVLQLPPITEAVKLFAEGASKERWRRQNTRWFTGVLLNPAPRDPERHWLQLAQLESQDDGRMGVRVLPTEEYQVRHLNEAEAICMIDKASSPEETEFPPGTVVHYFLLD